MQLGRKLWIRSLVHVAAEAVPFFWPMRIFVHHNPLHELEELPFEEAVKVGERLFGGKGYLRRAQALKLLRNGPLKERHLKTKVRALAQRIHPRPAGIDVEALLYTLLTSERRPWQNRVRPDLPPEAVRTLAQALQEDPKAACDAFLRSIGEDLTLYEAIDQVTGAALGELIDDLVVKGVMDFLDEGQAAISMPHREQGLFQAWKALARHNLRFRLKIGPHFRALVQRFSSPEEAIEYVLTTLKIPEALWENYIRRELTRLKGIVGFIRWRQANRDYYWQRRFPADIVDYTAIRLLISLAVLQSRTRRLPFRTDYAAFTAFVRHAPEQTYLRREYFTGRAALPYAETLPPHFNRPHPFVQTYTQQKAAWEAKVFLTFLADWLEAAHLSLNALSPETILDLHALYTRVTEEEGKVWLEALEDSLLEDLLSQIRLEARPEPASPKAQVLFCIDVRSERYRRNLERLGRYETFGVAGFFGVPMAFVELHKGHEEFLCPALIRPRNVVLDMPQRREPRRENLFKRVLHDLKENILTPFITVEALGFLFGLDFVGKTFLPVGYTRAREAFLDARVHTKPLLDRLAPEEIEEVTRTLYGEVVRTALEKELGLRNVSSAQLHALFEDAVANRERSDVLSALGVPEAAHPALLRTLRETYRVERGYVELVKEKLRGIGFSREEQAALVANTLRSIGLTQGFAPLVLVLGHGSRSENNPYESALDCGACGGAAGTHNARVFCFMANHPKVRELLKQKHGISIPETTHFVPGLHNTTTDAVQLYDLEYLPSKLLPVLEGVRADLEAATLHTAQERALELGVKPEYAEVLEHAYDWSQVRPEWGLSGNYAFVIGRREVTRALDLKGKVFLHSYDYRVDPKGRLLENILSGPLIVGHWINMEHYFSTTDNEAYGSGSKVYHNVAGRIGVMTGNVSDLRTGLPAQTVLKQGEPFHLPVRLIVLLEAPFAFARTAIERVHKVRELMHKGWLNMVVLDPEERVVRRFMQGAWRVFGSVEEVQR
ncbi:DUF2309 domain-containing protein [Marinithermus hydrothermalis]|uniref:Probable inorganic carbon transporter subunit DabA n=1 Tax=Marinithermus hydrothermalis (strain DSM 14884 / JCM 11576 / T1) TaxID=869210 RepID=F2NMW0_MARHT|nr:DUF2309 domain-containing protein [Marinithermus hydrothermalis]AEB12699.1 UPF0753 protein [Marinithermus hydrothermalis DSM 14884]